MPHKYQRWRNIMKCYPFEEKRLLKWEPPFIVHIKYDGDRGVDVPLPNGSHLVLSSEENVFHCLPHINEALEELNCPYKLDGELYNHEIFLEGGHDLIHSICSRSVNIHPRYKEMQLHIFDYQETPDAQHTRIVNLGKLKHRLKHPLVYAPYWICDTLDEVKRVYDKVIELHYEGIIIRNAYATYEIDKRSRWLMKFKPKKQDKYKIIGWKEEVSIHGVPKGRIGSIVLSSQAGDEFAVSAGLDSDEKEKYWKIRDQLAGHDAIVHYQHLTNRQIPKGTFDIEILI